MKLSCVLRGPRASRVASRGRLSPPVTSGKGVSLPGTSSSRGASSSSPRGSFSSSIPRGYRRGSLGRGRSNLKEYYMKS